jgi:hypothetical protein
MRIRPESPEQSRRGQAIVEFALILPLLVLLLVMALDFGRVFFGWVSLTNASRVGANYAGLYPELLTNSGERDDYEDLVGRSVSGCELEPADLNDAAYDPVFTDMDGDGKSNGYGDHVTVTLACEFDLMTPLASMVLGNSSVTTAAEAVFPVRKGTFAGPGGGPPPGPGPCTLALIPDLINRTVAQARDKWVNEGFLLANFTANPDIDDNLVNSQYFTPAAAVQDCVDPAGQSVHVTSVPPPPCPAGQAQVPHLIGDLVADARLEWSGAGFTGSFNPGSADNSKTVLTQVTNPVTSPPIGGCAPVNATVTITFGDPPPDPCEVPNMIGKSFSVAGSLWTGKGFTNPLVRKSGPTGGAVEQQTPTHPGVVSCEVVGEVRLRN